MKDSYIAAIKVLNMSPDDFKVLAADKATIKRKLKSFTTENI